MPIKNISPEELDSLSKEKPKESKYLPEQNLIKQSEFVEEEVEEGIFEKND